MTINELVYTAEWADVEHERVIVKDLGGNVYYDEHDLQVDPFDTDEYPVPEWAERQILMCHHNVGDSGEKDYEEEVTITII